ncbi:MAG: hypothetical protein OXN89_02510 [Bryobacterales bacterium]|nr:hypothetical protein [Bryobacterales bacterium]
MFEQPDTPTGEPSNSDWLFWARLTVKVLLVFGALYVGYHFYERHRLANVEFDRPQTRPRKLPADVFAFVPKSYVTDLVSARRRLIGKPLWVKEGYRWPYDPGGRVFGPLERIVPTAVEVRGNDAVLVFDKDGARARFGIGSPQRVFIDDIFFVTDPKEIYDHWTPEMWQSAAAGEVAPGMSEIRIGFALGAGEVVRQSPGGATRIVDYKLCAAAGIEPVRVTYLDHVATAIEPLPR